MLYIKQLLIQFQSVGVMISGTGYGDAGNAMYRV